LSLEVLTPLGKDHEHLECQIKHLGSDHPETLAIRAKLATILLEKVTCDVTMEV
jgi:hypothetical protein